MPESYLMHYPMQTNESSKCRIGNLVFVQSVGYIAKSKTVAGVSHSIRQAQWQKSLSKTSQAPPLP